MIIKKSPKNFVGLPGKLSWVLIFKESVSQFENSLLNACFSEQKKMLSQISKKTIFRENAVGYAILLKSPNIDCSEFLKVLEPILDKASSRNALSFLGLFNRSDLVEKFIDLYQQVNPNYSEIEKTFENAASTGRINTIRLILKKFPEIRDRLLFTDGRNVPFYSACINNQEIIVQYYMNMCSNEEILQLVTIDNFDIIKDSIKHRCFDTVLTLTKIFMGRGELTHLMSTMLNMIREKNYNFLNCMALSYEWKKLMYFLLLFPEGIYSILIKNNLMILICAIATNNIQMIEFISNNISKTEFVEIIGVVESLKS